MDKEIVSALIGLGGTVLGFLLSEVAGAFKRKGDEKERLILTNLSMRQQAYSKVFAALSRFERYLYNFTSEGNEFTSSMDPSEFAPLEDLTALMQEYEAVEIWLHDDTIAIFNNFFSNSSALLNLSIHCYLKDEIFEVSNVSEACRGFIEQINNIKKHLRMINGMRELDEHSSKMFKKTSI